MNFPKGVTRCKKPKMREHRGRTWDQCDLTLPDGSTGAAYLDTSWGTRFYFVEGFIWRSGPIDEFKREISRSLSFDLRSKESD